MGPSSQKASSQSFGSVRAVGATAGETRVAGVVCAELGKPTNRPTLALLSQRQIEDGSWSYGSRTLLAGRSHAEHGRGEGGASVVVWDLLAIRTHDDRIVLDPRMDRALVIVIDGLCGCNRPWWDRLVKYDEPREHARVVVVFYDTETHTSEQETPAAKRDSIRIGHTKALSSRLSW